MKARRHYFACTMKKASQYTIRGVSARTDGMLREMAGERGVSLNTLALSLLDAAAGADDAARHHDLDALAGAWVADAACDQALRAFDRIERSLWK